jgi:hypothetical protein
MPIRAACPAGHAMMVPDHRAGTRLRCPRCGVELLVPGEPKDSPEKQRGEKNVAAKAEEDAAEQKKQDVPPPAVEPARMRVPVSSEVERVGDQTTDPPIVEPVVAPPAPTTGLRPASQTPGWVPTPEHSTAALYLSILLAGLAIFGVAPAVWEWYILWQNADAPPTPPWVFALLITGVLQLAFAVYLAQVPDWSALWTTTVAMLGAAAAWATLLGATLQGRQESTLVLLFRYADKLEGNRAAMWCFIMLCFTSVLAYFFGLTAARWQKAHRLLRKLRDEAAPEIV